jgi:hypothetical protein
VAAIQFGAVVLVASAMNQAGGVLRRKRAEKLSR